MDEIPPRYAISAGGNQTFFKEPFLMVMFVKITLNFFQLDQAHNQIPQRPNLLKDPQITRKSNKFNEADQLSQDDKAVQPIGILDKLYSLDKSQQLYTILMRTIILHFLMKKRVS